MAFVNSAYIDFIVSNLNENLSKADFFTDKLRGYFDLSNVDSLTPDDLKAILNDYKTIAVYVSALVDTMNQFRQTSSLIAEINARKGGVTA